MQFLFDVYALDTDRRELRRGTELVPVEPQVFDLLVHLVENRDRVVTKDDMLASVWGGRIVSESTLTSRISAVRKAIGDTGGEGKLVRTIARKGLRFVGAVTEGATPRAAAPERKRESVAAAAANNLPLRTASFFGREDDVAHVRDMLGTQHLVTLIGAGGIGKTTLALEIAAGILDRFPDGIWFVELAPVADPKLVPNTVADALGLVEEPGRPLLATLLNFVRSRELLIVLDNCEHVVEACARFADSVLRSSSGARILATSREPLGITGEYAWRVLSLPTPDPNAQTSADDLVRYPAARLFAERAKFARASFEITEQNALWVSRICWQLDGIPLAIELAASRVKAMQVEQIVERLGDRFRLLTGGSRTASPHQQTLRSTIDWSYGLLSEAERALLNRLSVFAGGWTLEAAEAVCGDSDAAAFDVLDTLTHLLDKSLVILDERGPEPRYRMLETIRQYGNEKLVEAGHLEAFANRHLQYFVTLAEYMEPHFFHPDQAKWYARADTELDNSRVALEWAVSSRQADLGIRLIHGLHRYWVARVYWMEATNWLRRLLALCDAGNPTPLHARAVFTTGHVANYYDAVVAEAFGTQSLQMSRALDYKQGIVNALWLLGWCAAPKLDGSAVPYFEESIKLASEIDYPFGWAHGCAWYGVYKAGIGDYEGAKPLLESCKAQAIRLGDDVTLLARSDGNLGLIAMLQGDYAAAKAYLDNSMALVTSANNKNGTAEALWFQGRLALRRQNHAAAIDYFVESAKLYQIYADSFWITRALAYLVIAFAASGETGLAAHIAGALHGAGDRTALLKAHLGSRQAIAEYEEAVAALRATLSADEFEAAWAAGCGMTREEAIARVLERGRGQGPRAEAVA